MPNANTVPTLAPSTTDLSKSMVEARRFMHDIFPEFDFALVVLSDTHAGEHCYATTGDRDDIKEALLDVAISLET